MKREEHFSARPSPGVGNDAAQGISIDRRGFLKAGAAGLIVLFRFDRWLLDETELAAAGRQGYPADFNAYLLVKPDGRVTCFVGKIEMGQGPILSLAQLLAEELDVAIESVDMVMGDTDLCPWDMGTFGSLSVRQFGPVLRQAAAEARSVLLQLASEKLQVPVERLTVRNGVVFDTSDRQRSVNYADLTRGRRIERKVESKPPLKSPSSYAVVGKSIPRPDGVEKVTGRAMFAGDIVPPPGGVLHARILRPPAHGATLASVDTSAAEKQPGVVVIRDGDLVAVLHEHRDEADKALQMVTAKWTRNDPPVNDRTIFDHLVKAAPPARTAGEGGSLEEGENASAEVIDETWFDSYVAHAPLETHTAVAAVEDGKVTVWAGTQTPFPLKDQLVRTLGLPPEKVRVITPYVGGGFGGKSASQQGIEAARLAVLSGRPVRVVWSREEEFFYDTFRPASVITIRSGFDRSGRIVLWDYLVYAAGDRGAAHFYDVAHHRTLVRGGWSQVPAGYHPFAIGPWRAPGANTNAFARESQIDVMAARAKLDPVEFRLKNLRDERMIRVLKTVAKIFGWKPGPAPGGRGAGVACGIDAGTYVATIAQVAVDKSTGKVRVERVACAQDMGIVVNPEGAMQQIEGCIMMGLGYTLSEEVHFEGGEISDRNFDTYEIPRFSWMPRIDAVLVDAPEIASQGGGEPAIVPMGAAIANAIFDAVGARLHRMPMTPDRIKEAMSKA